MGEWVVGAFINLFGSIAINFGTNLLKLGHDERERHALLVEGINGKTLLRPIISFQSWRIGILFFAFGNALNFISFGYAAQSLLAALGSIQFVSNIAFSYFVLQKTVTSISCHNFYCSWKHLPCCFWQSPITCLHTGAVGRKVQQHYIPFLLSAFGGGGSHASLRIQERRIVACYSRERSYEILEVTASFFICCSFRSHRIMFSSLCKVSLKSFKTVHVKFISIG